MAQARERGRAAPPAKTPAQPTSSAAWSQGKLYQLPSGPIARMRQPGLMATIARGQIPNPIAAQISALLTIAKPAESDEERQANFERNIQAFTAIAELAFVEPRLVLDRAPDYAARRDRPERGRRRRSAVDLLRPGGGSRRRRGRLLRRLKGCRALDAVAQRYGCRPSELVQEGDPTAPTASTRRPPWSASTRNWRSADRSDRMPIRRPRRGQPTAA